MQDSKPKTIDEYIKAAPEESQEIMEKLKNLIEAIIPGAEGGISWNVPIYKYNGILAGFDVAKKHVSFGIDSLQSEDREIFEEKGYKTGKKPFRLNLTKKFLQQN